MRITLKSPQVRPVFLDDHGHPMCDEAEAIRTLRYRLAISCREFGVIAGVSERTVENWEQGREPGLPALLKLFFQYGKREITRIK